MKRPRVIRKVVKVGRDGRPKTATDIKAGVAIKRITAHQEHRCGYPSCRWWRLIEVGTEYAQVFDGSHRPMGRLMIPQSQPYHFECVPPNARRLVRFFR